MKFSKQSGLMNYRARAWMVFSISASLVSIWFFVGGFITEPDARGLADGVKQSWYWTLSLPIFLLSFLGCVSAPFLSRETLERKIAFSAYAVIAFYIDFGLSGIITSVWFGFVD